MIINFSLENFGCFKTRQTLSFEADRSDHLENFYISTIGKYRLLKIALIYGANASGKTTLLNALDFLRELVLNPLDKKTQKLDFKPFLFDEKTSKRDSTLSIEFLQNKIKYSYEVTFNEYFIVKESLFYFNPRKRVIFKRSTKPNEQFTKIIFGRKIEIDKAAVHSLEANTLWNNTVLGGYLKTNIECQKLKIVIDWFQKNLYSIIYPKSNLQIFITTRIDREKIKKENVLNLLKKADLNISDIIIEVREDDIPDKLLKFLEKSENLSKEEREDLKSRKKIKTIELKFEHHVKGKKYILPFQLESQGTKRYYAFAGLLNLLVENSSILLIDELEASLHPDLYQHFLLTFLANSEASQIIATTHNRELLSDKDFIRDDAVWITDKDEEASTELYSLADFEPSLLTERTNRLNLYKSGRLGGIPNLGDYYLDLEE